MQPTKEEMFESLQVVCMSIKCNSGKAFELSKQCNEKCLVVIKYKNAKEFEDEHLLSPQVVPLTQFPKEMQKDLEEYTLSYNQENEFILHIIVDDPKTDFTEVVNKDAQDSENVKSFKKRTKFCVKCSKKENLRRCSRCQMIYYCSTSCQTKDWDHHKQFCSRAGQ